MRSEPSGSWVIPTSRPKRAVPPSVKNPVGESSKPTGRPPWKPTRTTVSPLAGVRFREPRGVTKASPAYPAGSCAPVQNWSCTGAAVVAQNAPLGPPSGSASG